MPPMKRQIKKTEGSAVRPAPYSKQRRELLKKVGAMVIFKSNKADHFADPSVDEIIESQNNHPETIKAQGKQPILDGGKEEFKQLTKTHEEELIMSSLEDNNVNKHEQLSMEELKLLEERTQYTLSLVKAKRREWEHYQKVRGELKQTAEKMSSEFQQTMGFHSADEAGEQNVSDGQRASLDSVTGAPVNQKEGL